MNKKSKVLLSALLSILLVFGVFAMAAIPAAAAEVTLDGVIYELVTVDEGEDYARIAHSTADLPAEVTIPATVEIEGVDYPVKSIDNHAFIYCSDLEKIILPEGLLSIGFSAFSGCSSLTEIVLPESLERLGDFAFSGCSSLKKIVLPKGLESLGDSVFSGCSDLEEIVFAEGLRSIGFCAFAGCSSLTEIVLPEGLERIDDYAFTGCSSLAGITIPASVTDIGEYVFLNVPEGLTIYCEEGSVAYEMFKDEYDCQPLPEDEPEQPVGFLQRIINFIKMLWQFVMDIINIVEKF